MELEYTWEALSTSAGCSAAVLLIMQYIKDYLPAWLPTRLAVLMLAIALLTGAWLFGGGCRFSDIPLIVVNGFTIARAAMGAYETALKGK